MQNKELEDKIEQDFYKMEVELQDMVAKHNLESKYVDMNEEGVVGSEEKQSFYKFYPSKASRNLDIDENRLIINGKKKTLQNILLLTQNNSSDITIQDKIKKILENGKDRKRHV